MPGFPHLQIGLNNSNPFPSVVNAKRANIRKAFGTALGIVSIVLPATIINIKKHFINLIVSYKQVIITVIKVILKMLYSMATTGDSEVR